MATATATKAEKSSKTPAKFADVPETDATDAKPARGGNSAYADEDTRAKIAQAMADLREKGFTRPSISAVTGFSDSQVWRAQNGKVHTAEVPTLLDFIKQVVDGKIQPPAPARKPKVEDLQAKIDAAIAKLGDEAKTVAQYRKVLEEAKALLTA